jgi:hypothetical protein
MCAAPSRDCKFKIVQLKRLKSSSRSSAVQSLVGFEPGRGVSRLFLLRRQARPVAELCGTVWNNSKRRSLSRPNARPRSSGSGVSTPLRIEYPTDPIVLQATYGFCAFLPPRFRPDVVTRFFPLCFFGGTAGCHVGWSRTARGSGCRDVLGSGMRWAIARNPGSVLRRDVGRANRVKTTEVVKERKGLANVVTRNRKK